MFLASLASAEGSDKNKTEAPQSKYGENNTARYAPADVDVGALLQQRAHLLAVVAQVMLHVHLGGLR
jgi:hypothetical protein